MKLLKSRAVSVPALNLGCWAFENKLTQQYRDSLLITIGGEMHILSAIIASNLYPIKQTAISSTGPLDPRLEVDCLFRFLRGRYSFPVAKQAP